MTHKQANVRYLGPLAEHDVQCALHGCPNPAVLNMNTGVFEPCWRCQTEGWKLERTKEKRRRTPAMAGLMVALSVVGVVTAVMTDQWLWAIMNVTIGGYWAFEAVLQKHRRELKGLLRRRAELAGQIEHEGPVELPAARLEERRSDD